MHFSEKIYHETYHANDEVVNLAGTAIVKPDKAGNKEEAEPKKEITEPKKEITEPITEPAENEEDNEDDTLYTDTGDSE